MYKRYGKPPKRNSFANLQGPKDDRGEQDPQGNRGDKGQKDDRGERSPHGEAGPEEQHGSKGDKLEQGKCSTIMHDLPHFASQIYRRGDFLLYGHWLATEVGKFWISEIS